MRPRLLGLAVLAALAATAFVGTGSVSATTLCKVNTNPCPVESRYPSGTTILGESTSQLVGETVAAECNEATVEIETLAQSASEIPATLSLPTFAECSEGETKCTQEALLDPYEGFFYEPIGGNGRLGLAGDPGDEFILKVDCGLPCAYVGGMKFKITGGNPAVMTVFAWQPTVQSGEGCGSTVAWTVSYSLNNLPAPLYVQASP